MSEQTPPSQVKKVKKPQGPIRWNAIVPLGLFVVLIFAYFHFFFDSHIRSLMEWGGYKALGTEINIGKFESSFFNGRVEINKIEITDSLKPEFNSIELGSIRFDVNWDALLRMKIVVQEMAVEGIQFMSKRAYPGKVAPPEPPSNEPSFTDELQKKALNKLEGQNKNNVLGDIGTFLKSGGWDEQLKNIESQMASKKQAEALKEKWAKKQIEWDQKIKTLPTEKDLQSFKTRFDGIKYKDFKTPQEVQASVDQFNALKKDVDEKVKLVDSTKNNLNEDLKSLQTDYSGLEAQIKNDIDSIKTRFKIPKLDAGAFAKSLFMDYLTPYTQKLDRYKKLAQKYLPPKYSQMLEAKKGSAKGAAAAKDDDSIQPLPREKGLSYEFPVTKGYPLFWIQNIKISSKSNAQTDYGDIQGQIKDITSNQKQIGKETEIHLGGSFNSMKLTGLKLNAFFNNMHEAPEVRFDMGVGSYPIADLSLIQSDDGTIKIPATTSSLAINGKTIGFKNYDLNLKNEFRNVKFESSAKEPVVADILKQTFATIDSFDLVAKASGEITNLDIDISSSLGDKLQASFNALLQKKIDEVNKQIREKVDQEIGKYKKDIDDQVAKFKGGFTKEIDATQAKLDGQKKGADDRINQAKKDLENKAKGQLQQEGQKTLDDLKKKLGF